LRPFLPFDAVQGDQIQVECISHVLIIR
jgi:hypothetical protein